VLNFTFDEISALLGIDHARMYEGDPPRRALHGTSRRLAGALFPKVEGHGEIDARLYEGIRLQRREIRLMANENTSFIVG